MIEVTTDGKAHDSSICALVKDIRFYFRTYQSGDAVGVQRVKFLGSESECSALAGSDSGTSEVNDEVGLIADVWWLVLALGTVIVGICAIQSCRSKLPDQAEETNYLKVSEATDSEASPHEEDTDSHILSSVDVRRCNSKTCSCSGPDCVQWVKVAG